MTAAPDKRPLLPALSGVRFLFAVQVVIIHVGLFYEGGAQPSREAKWQADEQHSLAEQLALLDGREAKLAGEEQAGLAADEAKRRRDEINGRRLTLKLREWCQQGHAAIQRWPVVAHVLHGGAMNVSMFFVLSGFIMMYTYVGAGTELNVPLGEFWFARWTRIYPIYLLALVGSFPLFLVELGNRQPPIEGRHALGMAAAAVTLLQSWWPAAARIWNGPGWSLSVEVVFYALFPWLASFFARLPRRAIWPGVALCWLACIIPSTLYEVLSPDGLGRWGDSLDNAFWLDVVRYNPLIRLPEFVMGLLLGRYFELRLAAGEGQPHGGGGAWWSCGALAVVVLVMIQSHRIPHIVVHNGLMTPVFFVLLYGLILGGGPLHSLLSRPWVALCGDSTYAMYILHYTVIAFCTVLMVLASVLLGTAPLGAWAFVWLCLGASTLISVVAYTRFEIPVRRWLRKTWSPRPKPVPVPAGPSSH